MSFADPSIMVPSSFLKIVVVSNSQCGLMTYGRDDSLSSYLKPRLPFQSRSVVSELYSISVEYQVPL